MLFPAQREERPRLKCFPQDRSRGGLRDRFLSLGRFSSLPEMQVFFLEQPSGPHPFPLPRGEGDPHSVSLTVERDEPHFSPLPLEGAPYLFPLPLGEGEGEGGKLLHIIAVAHPIVPEDVTVVPEF